MRSGAAGIGYGSLVAATLGLIALPFLAVAPPAAPAKVSYARQLRPLFENQCLSCHSGPQPASGYGMDSRERLLKGGRHGAAVLPGRGAESALVRYLTGDLMPRMPSGAPPFDKDTIALIRRWIDEGAVFDAATTPVLAARPTPTPLPSAVRVAQTAPVTALAYSPDGKYLATGGYRAIRLLDANEGRLVKTIPGPADQVQALAWSPDGKLLAAAGGVPGAGGEIVLLDPATGRVVQRLTGHEEVVDTVAWRPNAPELATGSLDKTMRIWNTENGHCLRVIKEHADAVLCVAYSPDGKYLATAGADRTAKLLDATTYKPLQTLSAHSDAVTGIAFRPDGALLATSSADKTVRIWKVEPGKMVNPERTLGEEDAILSCAFSRDSGAFAYGSANRRVKLFSGDGKDQKQQLPDAPDWMYAVAFSPDGKRLAAGSQNGATLLWDLAQGKRVVPTPPAKATP